MIAHLRGRLIQKQAPLVTIEASGVGYEVMVSVPTYSALGELGEEAALFIHTHVREDQLALFGFLARDEKRLFERLLAVSGIGPKLAMTVLSGMPAPQLVATLKAGDLGRLTKTPGIGKKTAERMVLELRDKLGDFAVTPDIAVPAKIPLAEDVLSALVNLGYQRPQAERAVESAVAAHPSETRFEAIFRAALATLTR